MIDNTRALRTLRRLCDTPPLPIGRAHQAAIQLEQDIAAALKVWRSIWFVPDALVVRVPAEDMPRMDSLYVTVIPLEAA